jgi:hypothetical protein
MNTIEMIQMKVAELRGQLLEQHPALPTLLREIHKTLRENPECVTLLEPEEVGVVVSGLLLQTQTTIATKAATSKKKTAITLADL